MSALERRPTSERSATASDAELYLADVDLVRRVLAGDDAALAEFAERMRVVPRVLAVLNSRLARPLGAEDLADLAQETLVAIWRRLDTFEGRARIETWAQRFCFHRLMNAVRSERRRPVRAAEGGDVDTLDSGSAPAAGELDDHAHLHELLERLGPPGSDVIRLKHYEERTFEDIGRVLRCSPNTAKTQYYRALRWLRAQMRPEDEA